MKTLNIEPSPRRDWTRMKPPWLRTMPIVVDRPSPVPFSGLFVL